MVHNPAWSCQTGNTTPRISNYPLHTLTTTTHPDNILHDCPILQHHVIVLRLPLIRAPRRRALCAGPDQRLRQRGDGKVVPRGQQRLVEMDAGGNFGESDRFGGVGGEGDCEFEGARGVQEVDALERVFGVDVDGDVLGRVRSGRGGVYVT